MIDPNVPRRMADLLPSAKLLFIFRNPFERAYSSYWYSVSIGTQNHKVSFSEAIRDSEGYEKYVAGGFYDIYLQRFANYYDLKNIYVRLMEDLSSKPLLEMHRCYQFLEIDSDFSPEVGRSYNRTIYLANRWATILYRSQMWIKNGLKKRSKFLPNSIRRNLAYTEEKIAEMKYGQDKPGMSVADREYLNNIFAPHNENLSKLIGRRTF